MRFVTAVGTELVLMQPFLKVRAQIDEVGPGLLIGGSFGGELRHKVMKARVLA